MMALRRCKAGDWAVVVNDDGRRRMMTSAHLGQILQESQRIRRNGAGMVTNAKCPDVVISQFPAVPPAGCCWTRTLPPTPGDPSATIIVGLLCIQPRQYNQMWLRRNSRENNTCFICCPSFAGPINCMSVPFSLSLSFSPLQRNPLSDPFSDI